MKIKHKNKYFFAILFASSIFFIEQVRSVMAADVFKYKMLESFPGFYTKNDVVSDLPSFILSIYNFGIWTIGIAALFMLVVGGFMYMASVGNTSIAGTAKGVIYDSLLGVAAALGAYLLMYVINPDLTVIDFSSITAVNIDQFNGPSLISGVKTKPDPSTGRSSNPKKGDGEGSGACKSLNTGPCSPANLANTCFGSISTAQANPQQFLKNASAICSAESGGIEAAASKTDKCLDGKSFSHGLFQLNITVHDVGGNKCSTGAFSGKNYQCRVSGDGSLYNKCVAAAQDATINMNTACGIYKASGWNAWGANKNCSF